VSDEKTATEVMRELRARAREQGIASLGNGGLLARVLADESGGDAEAVRDAGAFLESLGLCALAALDVAGLSPELGSSRAARVAAAFELAERVRARYAGATDPSQSAPAPANDNARAS